MPSVARSDLDTAGLQSRGLRMGIGAVLLLIAVAAEHGFNSLDLSTFYFLAVLAIIYVPPWESVPLVGRYARAAIAIIIAFTYPFFWDKLFTVPIFGSFPSVPTGYGSFGAASAAPRASPFTRSCPGRVGSRQ